MINFTNENIQKELKKKKRNVLISLGFTIAFIILIVFFSILEENEQEVNLTEKTSSGTKACLDVFTSPINFAYYENGIYNDDVKEDDKEAIWLKNNCWKYGFILRYPKGKEDITGYNFEPWHFRFVGLELAKKIYDEDLTLEEYYKNSNIIL